MVKLTENESQNVEYKESWRDEYIKWICGFANAQGGTIYIGVKDSKEICGVPDAKKLMEDIPNKVRDLLGIIVDVNLFQENSNEYIQIIIEASNVPISYKGQYHYRTGSTKQELKGVALQQFILKKMGKQWDDVAHESAKIDCIDEKTVSYFIKKAVAAGRLPEDIRNDDVETIFENLNLFTDDGKLKNAAILLFAKNPLKFFTGIKFKIGRFRINEADLIFQDEIEGNIFQMADKVVNILKSKYLRSFIHYEGMQRIETLEIPENALRELLYNAIVHKQYPGYPILMHVYDDHIELWNEGSLPDGYTVETLLSKHSSKPRNSNIANVFYKAGFIEAWGRGYTKIMEGFKSADLPLPTLQERDGGLVVNIPRDIQFELNKDVVQDDSLSAEMGDKWAINQIIIPKLVDILTYMSKKDSVSTDEISSHFNYSVTTTKRYLQTLVKCAYIEPLGANKNRTYKLKKKE